MSPGLLIALILGGVLLLSVAAVLIFRGMMNQPLYKPGMVRAGKYQRAPLTPPHQPADPDFWMVENGIRLWHFATGTGRNALVVHGGPGYPYRKAWTGLEPLAGAFRFHYYDQRGCGRSTRPIDTLPAKNTYQNIQMLEQTLGISAQLADIERIRQILGEEKLVLFGASFGAFLATLYAAEFPERAEALVLVAPADLLIMPQAHGGLFEHVRERLPARMRDDYAAYLADYLDFKGIFEKSEDELATLNGRFATYYQVAYDMPIEEQGRPGGWMVQAQYFSLGKRHDYRAAMRAVSAPALVIHGENDLQPEAASRLYAQTLPGASFTVVKNASHFPFEEQPEAFAAAVAPFFAELGMGQQSYIATGT